MSVKLIAAIDDKLGLARNDKLPWDLPSDRKYFRRHVMNGPVVMGWKTFISNGRKPYGNGQNYVISQTPEPARHGVLFVLDVLTAIKKCGREIWVVGGGKTYAEALPYADALYLTRVAGDYECNVAFPAFESSFELVRQTPVLSENGIKFRYEVWQRARPE